MIFSVLVIFIPLLNDTIQLLVLKSTFKSENAINRTEIHEVVEKRDIYGKYMGFFGEAENALNECFEEPKIWCNTGTKYRKFDGSCNNLNIRSWGMANTALLRIIPANYYDGIKYPRKAKSGNDLPDPLLISRYLSQTVRYSNRKETALMIFFTQLVARDVAIEMDKTEGPINCCDNPTLLDNGVCMTFGKYKTVSASSTACYNLIRSKTTDDVNCSLKPIHQLSNVTSYLDASFLYGVNNEMSNDIRLNRGGRLRTQQGSAYPFPSLLKLIVDDNNKFTRNGRPTYNSSVAGINQNAGMSTIAILFFRLHNFLCDILAWLNPHWKDEKLFHEARRIVIASYQHVIYYEFLPIIVGVKYTQEYELLPLEKGYLRNYNPEINPTTINSFSTTAFRIFQPDLQLSNSFSVNDETTMETELKITSRVVNFLRKNNNYDEIIEESLRNSFARKIRPKVQNSSDDVPDLLTINILRERDHGIPTYNEFLEVCGYRKALHFQQYKDYIKDANVDLLSELYEDVNDVDLYVGLTLEEPIDDNLAGPTSRCIVAEAFYRWKFGDRFFYEFAGQAGSFAADQLKEIRKMTMSFIVCVGSNDIESVQVNSFYLPSELNPSISCQSILRPDFSYWKEMK